MAWHTAPTTTAQSLPLRGAPGQHAQVAASRLRVVTEGRPTNNLDPPDLHFVKRGYSRNDLTCYLAPAKPTTDGWPTAH